MQKAHDVVRDHPDSKDKKQGPLEIPEEVLAGYPRDLETGIEEGRLRKLNEELLAFPKNFDVFGTTCPYFKKT